jgi:peptidoglycan/LPS O-acetylase OafA/YrhL
MRISLVLPILLIAFLWLPGWLRPVALVASMALGAIVPVFLVGIDMIPMFLLGIAIAIYIRPTQRPFWITAPFLCSGALLYVHGHFGLPIPARMHQYVEAIGAAMLIVGAMSSPAVKRALTIPPVAFLGDISYSLYLVHLPILAFVASWVFPATGSRTFAFIASCAATFVIATLFRKFIEVPAQRRFRSPPRFRIGREQAQIAVAR